MRIIRIEHPDEFTGCTPLSTSTRSSGIMVEEPFQGGQNKMRGQVIRVARRTTPATCPCSCAASPNARPAYSSASARATALLHRRSSGSALMAAEERRRSTPAPADPAGGKTVATTIFRSCRRHRSALPGRWRGRCAHHPNEILLSSLFPVPGSDLVPPLFYQFCRDDTARHSREQPRPSTSPVLSSPERPCTARTLAHLRPPDMKELLLPLHRRRRTSGLPSLRSGSAPFRSSPARRWRR